MEPSELDDGLVDRLVVELQLVAVVAREDRVPALRNKVLEVRLDALGRPLDARRLVTNNGE